MWKIKQIFDGDYGCEELPAGEKPKVSVTLENEDGQRRSISVEDDWLTENNLNEGSAWLEYNPSEKDILDKYEFRNIRPEEADQAVIIEQICFPPHEACSEKSMKERIARAPELFLVAVDRKTGKLAGFLNGLSTDENLFRDEFFTDIDLYNPAGKNIMLLGLDVLPEHRNQGLARELVFQYVRRERGNSRSILLLTCLDAKVEMYKKLGFVDRGIANSAWGGEEWHEMSYEIA
jgi:ribosomal protein S18 acetylase RimI-like enzyme